MSGNIQEIVEYALNLPRVFTIKELQSFCNYTISEENICNSLYVNPRFLISDDKDFIISRSSLLKRLVGLINEVVDAGINSISVDQFNRLIKSSLLIEENNKIQNIIDFGRNLGLLINNQDTNRIIFPITKILSYLSTNSLFKAIEILKDEEILFLEKNILGNEYFKNVLNVTLSGLNPRTAEIISARKGIDGQPSQTLEKIGKRLGLSRERVRQIEKKAWGKIAHHSKREYFLKAFLHDFIFRQGSLLSPFNSPDTPYKMLISEIIGIPFYVQKKYDLVVFGFTEKDFFPLESELKKTLSNSQINIDMSIPINEQDFSLLNERVNNYVKNTITKQEKAYQALKALGRPSHYSQVAKKYTFMFSEVISDHSIHVILNRYPYDVVWIGTRGTYALKEWGYKQSKEPLYEMSARIVKEIYLKTNTPVSLNSITSELGRYRQYINRNSLLMCIYFNKNIQNIGHDLFIPKKENPLEGNQEKDINEMLENFSHRDR